eukprot:364218-Chlamydomonas_euryale.AAC.6
MEFLSFMHTSWRFSTKNRNTKLDLFAFAHPRWEKEVSRLCTVLDLDAPFEGFTDVHSQCFVVFYPPPPEEIWHGYPFINNVHFFADDRVAAIMTRHYGCGACPPHARVHKPMRPHPHACTHTCKHVCPVHACASCACAHTNARQ